MAPHTAPCGSWKSPITSDLIVAETITLSGLWISGADLYWLEMRPAEAGRVVLVRRSSAGRVEDLTPPPFNVRTRVHEYGGGAYVVADGGVYFSHFRDQRVYHLAPGAEPRPLTPSVDLRYADGVIDGRRSLIFCVREDHTGRGEAVNTIVSLDLAGSDTAGGRVLVAGHDFYSTPRLSPDGGHLAWLAWNHPNMPWDGTELWMATVDLDGGLSGARQVAGGPGESIFQPEWSPDGTLYFVSDRTGWWNLRRLGRDGRADEPVYETDAEFGFAQWVFRTPTYAFESANRIVCTFIRNGEGHLGTLNTRTRHLREISTPYTAFSDVRAMPGTAVVLAGSPSEATAVVQLDLESGRLHVVRCSSRVTIDPAYLSKPEPLAFPADDGTTAYAFFYPPRNPDFVAPPGEKPPLMVISHGGPTGAAWSTLNLTIQYWTSRGFGVLDVNYGGSTGYGRAYRERLSGRWGVVDVDDCVSGARYLVRRGDADPNRLAIRGGSAGGYTTLAALTFRDLFKAGASYFGISDLEALARTTHKLESRYLDRLIGPYPEQRHLYVERSPIHFADRLTCPLILFQGLEDKVVPPEQSETMFQAARAKGLPIAYLAYEGEQHGFRQAKNIKRSLDAELYFYSKVFAFPLADPVEPVEILNLPGGAIRAGRPGR